MRRFKSVAAKNFCAAPTDLIYQYTQPKRHQLPAFRSRSMMMERMHSWREITRVSVSGWIRERGLFVQEDSGCCSLPRVNLTIPPSLREYWQKRATDKGKKYWAKGSKYEAVAKF